MKTMITNGPHEQPQVDTLCDELQALYQHSTEEQMELAQRIKLTAPLYPDVARRYQMLLTTVQHQASRIALLIRCHC